MGKERQANFNNVAMFSFSGTVLLVGVWTWDVVRYPNALKKKEFRRWYSPPQSVWSARIFLSKRRSTRCWKSWKH
jgi:hypothetical protein